MGQSGSVAIEFTGKADSTETAGKKAAAAVDSVSARATSAGNVFSESLGRLPSLLSGGGIESVAEGIASKLSGIAESGSEITAKLGPAGPAIAGVAAAAAIGISLIVGYAEAVKSIVEPQMAMIDSTYKVAKALDIPTDALMTFHNVAKLEANLAAEDVDAAMKKLAKNLGAAADGSGPAANALKELHLSGEQLKSQNLGQNFVEIVDHLKNIPAESDRAVAATALLGKQGLLIASAFAEGKKGIDAAHAAGLANGTVLDGFDTGKVEAAHKALESVEQTIVGIKNRVTVDMAPVIEFLAEGIQSFAPQADSVGGVVVGVAHGIVTAVAMVADGVNAVRLPILVVDSATLHLGSAWLSATGAAAHGIATLTSLIPGMGSAAKASAAQIDTVHQAIADQAAAADASIKSIVSGPSVSDRAESMWTGAIDKSNRDAKKLIGQTKEAGEAVAEQQEENGQKLEQATAKLADALDFSKFTGGQSSAGWGAWLKAQGVDESKIQDVFAVFKAGGEGAVAAAAQQAVALQHIQDSAKGTAALDDLRTKLQGVTEAVAHGIDPKYAEEIAKLRLDPSQASEFIHLSEGIKSVNDRMQESERIAKKLADAQDALTAAKQHMTLEEYRDAQANPAAAAAIKAADDQRKAIEDAAKATADAQHKMTEDGKRMWEETRTPAEKYQEQVDKINEALKANAIDKDTAGRELAKAADDRAKAEKKDGKKSENQSFATETRRFALAIPGTKDQSAQAERKKQTQLQTQSERWLRDIRNATVDASGSPTASIDDLA